MNAQFPITTTPKYNFPLPIENLQLPQQLIELSIRSLKKTQSPSTSLAHEYGENPLFGTALTELNPNTTKTTIAAVDVSSIKLGETSKGVLLAVRGAVVWRHAGRHRYLRLGPFPYHITDKSKDEINSLHPRHQTPHTQDNMLPNIIQVQTKLTMLLERWIQTYVNQTTHDSLILWDGSLTAGTPETPIHAMEQLLTEAANRRNTILAFSKMTRLLCYGQRITDLVWKHPPPCLLRIGNASSYGGPMHSLGDVYVAKLSGGSCAFRLDVDARLSNTQAVDAVQRLLGNDLVMQSYPETLRLAHIYSTFTANEVLGMQRCIAKESNVKIVARPNVRRLLFGCFGKGAEGN